MDISKFTKKSQEALSSAQDMALRWGQQEVDGEHLLLALLEQSEGLIPRILQKMNVPVDALKKDVERELEKRPRVSGPGLEPGKIYISRRVSQILVQAQERAE